MSTKEKVMEELLNSDDYISGETLAQKLGVGRNSVWKAVKQLQEEGFDIQAINNKGYILKSTGDILNREIIKSFLDKTDDREIIVLDETDSTNNYAKDLARKGAKNATAVIADCQTAGKGRMGRSFCSPHGTSIYLSIILRPETDMETCQLITSCAAVAAAQAIDKVCGTDVKIKWVNDLFYQGRKVCGILTEAVTDFESGDIEFVVVGMGLNICLEPELLPESLKEVAGALYQDQEEAEQTDRNRLAAMVVNELRKETKDLKLSPDYVAHNMILGHQITITDGTSVRKAEALEICPDGRLKVREENGEETIFSFGEVSVAL